ncbi:MAG: histidine phosphatase family protein [Spirochaetes bacterium]|nr:histidine phosphatase family protein [Spirochaetota bacterium]
MIRLKNTYFIMRHGESEANEKRIIISSPLTGISRYGLTPKGRFQVLQKTKEIQHHIDITYIICSDFLRTLETAQLVAAQLAASEVRTNPLLRERFFGSLEGGDDSMYEIVWEMDEEDPDHHEYGVESCREVAKRAIDFILECEREYHNETILVVSHGDVLNIMCCAVNGIPVRFHRTIKQVEKAEIRRLL